MKEIHDMCELENTSIFPIGDENSALEREEYAHDGFASDEYTYNGLRFFWNGGDAS